MRRAPLDPFITSLLAMVALASVLPCRGAARLVFSDATVAAIALMFFLQGARLSRGATIAGLAHWRLHLTILLVTFGLFPLLGLALHAAMPGLLPAPLWLGLLFVCTLPSTVQSSIAFTSIAGGNVAGAIVSATASNLIGIVATPLLVGLLLSLHGGISLGALRDVALQLLAPFAAGQLLETRIGPWVRARKALTTLTDRGSILLVVYTAFSAAVTGGLWRAVSLADIARVSALDALLLALALALTTLLGRVLGFDREDRIAILFCGSKKSLATGVPMARLLFATSAAGLVVVPLMIFHQLQLMACAVIARRLAPAPQPAPQPATQVDEPARAPSSLSVVGEGAWHESGIEGTHRRRHRG